MRRNTPARARQEREYMQRRLPFLEANPSCAVCGRQATQVHHQKGRVAGLLLDERFWLPVCSTDHREITENPLWALERGYSLPRVGAA